MPVLILAPNDDFFLLESPWEVVLIPDLECRVVLVSVFALVITNRFFALTVLLNKLEGSTLKVS